MQVLISQLIELMIVLIKGWCTVTGPTGGSTRWRSTTGSPKPYQKSISTSQLAKRAPECRPGTRWQCPPLGTSSFTPSLSTLSSPRVPGISLFDVDASFFNCWDSEKVKKELRQVLWALYFLIQALIITSRMYIAAHFPHQCVLGLALGTLKLHFKFKAFISFFCVRFLDGKDRFCLDQVVAPKPGSVVVGWRSDIWKCQRDVLAAHVRWRWPCLVHQRGKEVVRQAGEHPCRHNALLQPHEIQWSCLWPGPRSHFKVGTSLRRKDK